MNAIVMPPVDETAIARRDQVVAALRAILGESYVIASEDERRAYETDALTAYRAVPLAVVLPGSTDEVSAVLDYLSTERIKVVARGAGTSATRVSPVGDWRSCFIGRGTRAARARG